MNAALSASPAAIGRLLRERPAHDAPEAVKAAWLQRKHALLAAIADAEVSYGRSVKAVSA